MPEAKLRENHARMEFLSHQVELLMSKVDDMKTALSKVDKKTEIIEKDIDYEKKQIDNSEELTFQLGLKQQNNFDEIKNDLHQLTDKEHHINIQKELAVVYGFDKTLNSRHLKILNFLLQNYNVNKKEFNFSHHNIISKETHIWRTDLTRLCNDLTEKSLIEYRLNGRKHEYRINPKLKKDELKAVEAEMERELS